MAIDLVSSPEVMTINLTRDADFIRIIEAVAPEEFPAGATVTLQFRSAANAILATWSAVVTATEATFNEDKAVVNTVITQAPATARLIYTDGPVDLIWGYATSVGIDG